MRLFRRTDRRPFELKVGDELIASPILGYMVLLKANGEVVDLNQLVMDLGSTDMCMDSTKTLDAFQFMQLASVLAASYGLVGSSVMTGWPALVVPVTAPGKPSGDGIPSQHAIDFMHDPQVPSLKSSRSW